MEAEGHFAMTAAGLYLAMPSLALANSSSYHYWHDCRSLQDGLLRDLGNSRWATVLALPRTSNSPAYYWLS